MLMKQSKMNSQVTLISSLNKEVLNSYKKLKRDRKMAILFIAHDLPRSVDDCLKIIKKQPPRELVKELALCYDKDIGNSFYTLSENEFTPTIMCF